MVIKNNELEFGRELYERMVGLNLQPKKMKAIFKRYMEFETIHGNQQGVDKVRKQALAYVESKFGAHKNKPAAASTSSQDGGQDDDDEMQDPMDQLMEMDD